MIRKILIFAVLVGAAAASIVMPLWKSDAAQPQTSGSAQAPPRRGLPNFDIRLSGRREFDDMDLSSTSGKQAAMQNARSRSRASAVGQFRSSLAAEKAANLRAVVNEAGAMKNFFIDGDTLSEPQSDTADNIARRFLERHNSLFALSGRAGIEELKLENEDNDQGTAFLSYTQTVGGLKVFEGHVQVVVNKNGEVLNVREGFLVDGPPTRRNGVMREANAIAKAFEHAGRNVFPSFVENHSRASTTEMSRFANP